MQKEHPDVRRAPPLPQVYAEAPVPPRCEDPESCLRWRLHIVARPALSRKRQAEDFEVGSLFHGRWRLQPNYAGWRKARSEEPTSAHQPRMSNTYSVYTLTTKNNLQNQ